MKVNPQLDLIVAAQKSVVHRQGPFIGETADLYWGLLQDSVTEFIVPFKTRKFVESMFAEIKSNVTRWFRNPDKKPFSSEMRQSIHSMTNVDELVGMAIPGIGIKLANELIEMFHSVDAVSHQSIEQLKQVRGIGDAKARAIYGAFRTGKNK